MDDRAKPYDAEADGETPESGSPEPRVTLDRDPFGRPSESSSEPAPEADRAQDLEPEAEPVAEAAEPVAEAAEPEPVAEAAEPEAATLFDTSGLEQRATLEEPPSQPIDAGAEGEEAAGSDSASQDVEAPVDEDVDQVSEDQSSIDELSESDLSLEDMVSELAEDDSLPLAGAVTETGPEIETIEGVEGAGRPETEEAQGTWRDEAASAAEEPPLARQRLSSRVPFWVYGGVWVIFVGVMTYLMWPISRAPFVGQTYYAYYILGGAALLAAGPLVGIGVWLSARMGATPHQRSGLVRAVALRAAGWMAVGVALMWISLYVLDMHRTGLIG